MQKFDPGRSIRYSFRGYDAELLPERAMWIPAQRWLIIADLHLGKVNHFRRSGIPVPTRANHTNAETLIQLLTQCRPGHVIFLGDLFHSHYNWEWEILGQITSSFPESEFLLISGNHDILGEAQYERNRIRVMHEFKGDQSVIFRHDPLPEESMEEGCYQVCGHVHPSVTLTAKGRPSERFPCFYFGERTALLPAFGAFTGMHRIHPRRGDRLFVVADGQVVSVG